MKNLLNENRIETNATYRQEATSVCPPGTNLRKLSTACLQKLQDLKERVTVELHAEFGDLLHSEAVKRAVNEADALAAITPFPALFLPALAEEKTRVAHAWQTRQQQILQRSSSLAFAA